MKRTRSINPTIILFTVLGNKEYTLILFTTKIEIQGSLNMFPDFFRMGTHETLVPVEVISSGCNALVLPFQQLLQGPMEVLLCESVNDLRQFSHNNDSL